MPRTSLALVACCTALCACGVTIEAKRVPVSLGDSVPTVLPRSIDGEGITYALPRTDFEIVQPLKVSIPTAAPLQEIQASCRRACEGFRSRRTPVGDACDYNVEARSTLGWPELQTVQAPDYTRLYQVSPSADLFQTLKFNFDIAANGVIDKASGESANLSYDFVSSVAQTVIKAGGSLGLLNAAGPLTLSSRNTGVSALAKSFDIRQRGENKSCFAVSAQVDEMLAKNPLKGTLSCKLEESIDGCLDRFEEVVASERTQLTQLFDDARSSQTIDSKLLSMLAANQQSRIDDAVSKRDQAAGLYGLGEGKPIEATYRIVVPVAGPSEFEPGCAGASLGASLRTGFARVIGVSENAAAYLPQVMALSGSNVYFEVSSTLPAGMTYATPTSEEPVGKGYRYRIPVTADVTLRVHDNKPTVACSTAATKTIFARRVVAQFGPIAALTSSFKGKGGHVTIKHWPESGGLQTVEIGADALPAKAVTDVVDTIGAQIKSTKDANSAAKVAAAAADPELDSLTRQQKVLALKKDIKDLEDALRK